MSASLGRERRSEKLFGTLRLTTLQSLSWCLSWSHGYVFIWDPKLFKNQLSGKEHDELHQPTKSISDKVKCGSG